MKDQSSSVRAHNDVRALFIGVIGGAALGGVLSYLMAGRGPAAMSAGLGPYVACLTPLLIGGGAFVGALVASCVPAKAGSGKWAPCGAGVGAAIGVVIALVSGLPLVPHGAAIVLGGAVIGAVGLAARRGRSGEG